MMECFTINREKLDNGEGYKPIIGQEWILPKKFSEECKEVSPINYVCCQAYVQILFVENGKWVEGMIGELVAYKNEKSTNEADMVLSFFSGPRQRFVINVSEIQKLTKPHPNLIVLIHGKTIMGLHFPLEHKNRVHVFYNQLRPHLPSTIFAHKLKQVAENVSEEMRKTANKLINTFSVDESKGGNQWLNNQKKIITKIIRKNSSEKADAIKSRRRSDPQLYPMPIPILASETIIHPATTINNKPPQSEAPKLEYYENMKSKQKEQIKNADKTVIENVMIKKRVTFVSEEQQNPLRRSQSLRKFYNEEVWIHQYTTTIQESPESYSSKSNVKNLIELWNNKTD